MGFFKIKKRSDVLDLSKGYKNVESSQKKEEVDLTNSQGKSDTPVFPFFSDNFSKDSSSNNDFSENSEEKRKRLAKRLVDMTNKLEELDNKIYHLQQRIEVLERKEGVTGFEKSDGFSF